MKKSVVCNAFVVILCVSFMSSGCQNQETVPQESQGVVALPAQPATVGRVSAHPTKPGAPPVITASPPTVKVPERLTLITGPTKAVVRGPFKVAATGIYKVNGHLYVAARLPDELARLVPTRANTHRVEVALPGRYGVAALRGDGGPTRLRGRMEEVLAGEPESGDRPGNGVIVRLVGSALPSTLPLKWHVLKNRRGGVEAGQTVLLTVTKLRKTAKDRTLQSRFFESMGENLGRNADGSLFSRFASQRLTVLAGKSVKADDNRPRRRPRSNLGDMMSLYTGASSIEEALQADRGLMIRNSKPEKRTIALSTMKGVPLASHPWEDMIKALETPPVIEPLASAVPFDMAYLHFPDLRTAVKMGNDLDQWIAPVMHLTEWRSGSSHMIARYEEELMIERMGLAEKLGHFAAKSVALTAGDPFLRDGTDLSIVFHINQETLLSTALALYESRARSRHPDLKVSDYAVSGHTVRWARTPDGRVNQHRLKLGDRVILSNSKAAITRFVGVSRGTVKALSTTGDFRYMRARYPYSENEAAYLFLGDAFVANAVSPRTKILQARRMDAQADLYAVGFGALLHGWLEGTAPADIQQVISAGTLKKDELQHADGSSITFVPGQGASSERWGRVAALTPLADLSIKRVTRSESRAYQLFIETYQRHWRAFIDPIAIRVNRSADGNSLSMDGLMLPLIEDSEYNKLIETVGKARVESRSWGPGLVSTLALGDHLRDMAKGMSGAMLGLGWVGDWLMFGVGDDTALWNLLVTVGAFPESDDAQRKESIAALVNAPLFLGVHVKSPLLFATFLTTVRAMVKETVPDILIWGSGQPHRGIQVVTVTPNTKSGWVDRLMRAPLSIYYAIAPNTLLISLNYTTLTSLIDAVLDGKSPRTPTDPAVSSQSELRLSMGEPEGGLALSIMGFLEHAARVQHGRAQRDLDVLVRGLGTLPQGDVLRQAGLGYLGFEPRSVHGGDFAMADGWLTHSLYGNVLAPRTLAIPVKGSPATRLIQGLKELEMSLGFEGEKESRGLHVKGRWDRK